MATHSRKRCGLYVFPEIDRVKLIRDSHRLTREIPRIGCRRIECRTMDIFHFACALKISSCRFLTFDARQGTLDYHAGLEMIELPPTGESRRAVALTAQRRIRMGGGIEATPALY